MTTAFQSVSPLVTQHAALLACPQCAGPLALNGETLQCGKCRVAYSLRDGIVNFSRDEKFFYSETKLERGPVARLLDIARTQGWQQGLDHIRKENPAEAADINWCMGNAARAAWKVLVNLDHDSVALDFGCGWGGLTFPLADNFKLVVAMDLTWERILLTKLRAEQSGVDNLLCVWGGDWPRLPFADNSLGLVVLNGVLEWLPEGKSADPREIQLAMLREIQRVLRPQGKLYIGIENRFGYRYFLGRREEHSGLKFVSLLPRGLANVYSRAKRGRPYRTHTYSLPRYRDLLRAAGFAQTKPYCPYIDYREFSKLIDLSSPSQLTGSFSPRSLKGRIGFKLLQLTGGFPYLCPSYGLVASKEQPNGAFIEELVAHLRQHLKNREGQPMTDLEVHNVLVTRSECVLVFLKNGRATVPSIVVRVPLSAAERFRAQKIFNTLQRIQQAPSAQAFQHLVPLALREETFQNQYYIARTHVLGMSGQEAVTAHEVTEQLVSGAVDCLRLIHQHGRADAVPVREAIAAICDRIMGTLQVIDEHRTCVGAVAALRNKLLQEAAGELPLVLTHGDYCLRNIIYSEGDWRVQGIIDWDGSDERGYPLVDLLRLLADFEWVKSDREFLVTYEYLLEHLGQNTLGKQMLAQYLRDIPLGPASVRALLTLFPLYQATVFLDMQHKTREQTLETYRGFFADINNINELVSRATA